MEGQQAKPPQFLPKLERPSGTDLPPIRNLQQVKTPLLEKKDALNERNEDESKQNCTEDKDQDLSAPLPSQPHSRRHSLSRNPPEETKPKTESPSPDVKEAPSPPLKSKDSPPQSLSPPKSVTRRSFDPHYEMAVGYSDQKNSIRQQLSLEQSPAQETAAKKALDFDETSKEEPQTDALSKALPEQQEQASESDSYDESTSGEEDDKTPLTPAKNEEEGKDTAGSKSKKWSQRKNKVSTVAIPRNPCKCCNLLRPRKHRQVADEGSIVKGTETQVEAQTGQMASTKKRFDLKKPFDWVWQGIVLSWDMSSGGERAAALSMFLVMQAEIYPSLPKINTAISAAAMILLGYFPWLHHHSTQQFYWLYTALMSVTLAMDIAYIAMPENRAIGLEEYIDAKEDSVLSETKPPSVEAVFKYSASMIGMNVPLKIYFWYCVLSRSPFGKRVLRTLNKRVLLFVPICPRTPHPYREVSNRMVALFWAHAVLGSLVFMVGCLLAFSFQWASQFTSDDFGMSLTAITLIKGISLWFVAVILLHRMDIMAVLHLFGCLALPGLREYYEHRHRQASQSLDNDKGRKRNKSQDSTQLNQSHTAPTIQINYRYLKYATIAKFLDWCIGVYMWTILAAESGETFSSGQVTVASMMGAIVFLLVVADIWLVLLAFVVYHIFINELSRPVDSSEGESSDDDSGVFESSSEGSSSEYDSSGSSEEGISYYSSSGGSYGSSSSSSEEESSSEDERSRSHRRRRKAKAKSQLRKAREQPAEVFDKDQPKGLDNLLLRSQVNQAKNPLAQQAVLQRTPSSYYEFDFSRAFDEKETARNGDIQLSTSFLITPEEFNSYWDSPAFKRTQYSCTVQLIPTVEVLSNHLQQRCFFVVASGKVAVYTKLYACAMSVPSSNKESVLFLMEMVFDRQNKKLALTFKCKYPDITSKFVKYLSLSDVVGAYVQV